LFIIEFKEEDSLMKKSQPLKMVIPLDINVKTVEDQDEFIDIKSQRKEKTYILHNSKRYRLPKKCYTE
jgi:hypothetical protein